jgi:parvulin-like peptidyl-prolyl isomerase
MVGLVSMIGCTSARSVRAASDDPLWGPVAQDRRTGAGVSAPVGAVATASYNRPSDAARIPPEAHVTARIRASVNGIAILDDEVREACYPFLVQTLGLPEPERTLRQKEILERGLQQIIEREMVVSEALEKLKKRPQVLEKFKEAAGKEFDRRIALLRKSNPEVKGEEDLKRFLQSQGLSYEGYRRQVEREFMKMEWLRNWVFPVIEREIGHEQIVEYYGDHAAEFERPERFHWQDIFVSVTKYPDRPAARKFAEALVARVQAGEDWAKLSSQYDDGDSVYRRGDGAGQKRGEIRPVEVEPVLLQVQAGQIAVVEVPNGFHVIRLVKHEPAGRVPFDDKTQIAIRDKLRNEVGEREIKRILADMKTRAQVRIETDTP